MNLAEQPVRALARIDQIYDLVAGNIASEIRGKIDSIGSKVEHPMAPAVAKAICLLQYVKSIHRTAENIAAALHPEDLKEEQQQLIVEPFASRTTLDPDSPIAAPLLRYF